MWALARRRNHNVHDRITRHGSKDSALLSPAESNVSWDSNPTLVQDPFEASLPGHKEKPFSRRQSVACVPSALAPNEEVEPSPERIVIDKRIFFDPRAHRPRRGSLTHSPATRFDNKMFASLRDERLDIKLRDIVLTRLWKKDKPVGNDPCDILMAPPSSPTWHETAFDSAAVKITWTSPLPPNARSHWLRHGISGLDGGCQPYNVAPPPRMGPGSTC